MCNNIPMAVLWLDKKRNSLKEGSKYLIIGPISTISSTFFYKLFSYYRFVIH